MKMTPLSRFPTRKLRVLVTVSPMYCPTSSPRPARMRLLPTNMPARAKTSPIACAMVVFPVPAPPMSMKFMRRVRNSRGSLMNEDTTSTTCSITCACTEKAASASSASTNASRWSLATSSDVTRSISMLPVRRSRARLRIASNRDAWSLAD